MGNNVSLTVLPTKPTCATCGLLALKIAGYGGTYKFQPIATERRADGHLDAVYMQSDAEVACACNAANVKDEILARFSELPASGDGWDTPREQQATREVLARERTCGRWIELNPAFTPSQHLEGQLVLSVAQMQKDWAAQQELDRRSWTERLEKDRREWTERLEIESRRAHEERETARIAEDAKDKIKERWRFRFAMAVTFIGLLIAAGQWVTACQSLSRTPQPPETTKGK